MNLHNELDYVPIGLASPEKIREWSYGEVRKPETINYKTYKPEKEGLFCERIFGPDKDFNCASWCGKYTKKKYKGHVCERCGVEVLSSKVRRDRMGHIELAVPVAHFWFFKSQDYISKLLNIPFRKLENIIYCKLHLVTDPGDTPLTKMELLTGSEYETNLYKYGDRFKSGIGAKVIKELLSEIDIELLSADLLKELEETKTKQKRKLLLRRLEIVEAFRKSNNRPEWMILDYMPVIPPELRPMVQLDGGRFATADLNDLYRRIINRNNRLKKLLDVGAPDIIIENEERMLQEAVDALIANHRRKHAFKGPGGRALKSLSNAIEGKQGRFRQNLLGKRVDYSGRSVITVGPDLKLHQCGIPRTMALELFKPFVINQMVEKGFSKGVNSARKSIENQDDEVWDVLEEVIDRHPVLLNRAPTLHKLSIRAFEPVIIEGKAITLHPLVCSGFNADFDGDQMAVHIPLSREAQAEARILMLASENLLHPQNGESAVTPSQDMVLGAHYLSIEIDGAKGEGKVFANEDEAIKAYENGYIDLHSKHILYVKDRFEGYKYLVTTIGKILFNRILPEGISFINDAKIETPLENGLFNDIEEAKKIITEKVNNPIKKSFLKQLIGYCYDTCGMGKTAAMLDGLKDIGFKYATKGGLTISLYDIDTPEEKAGLIKSSEKQIDDIEALYGYGRITEEHRYEQIIKSWERTSDKVADLAMDYLEKDTLNPIKMMIHSNARGSKSQYRQLAAMRGLMADPSGKTIERPIKANFKEGLTVFEYFISSHGARKGMADTSLKTADSGYLTRRLVDVSQDVVVTEEDCETEQSVTVQEIENWQTIEERISGRFLAETIKDEKGKILAKRNTMISNALALEIAKRFKEVPIRNVLTCEAERGVCRKCYGADLARRKEVEVGEAVGVIAAQSIGEPGTQLTMRTFHTGGIAGDDITQGLPRIVEIFEARKTPKGQSILTEVSGVIEIQEKGRLKEVSVHKEDGEVELYDIPYGATLLVKDGDAVNVGDMLTQGSINPHQLLDLKGLTEVQNYLIKEVQLVYLKQGVKINDKHIEIIIRQMCKKIRVTDPGDSTITPGIFLDRGKMYRMNKQFKKDKKKKIEHSDEVLGITKASLATDSFLSSASFQETAKVLTDAAVRGKKDYLKGLKESIIVGKKIPAGTGFPIYEQHEE